MREIGAYLPRISAAQVLALSGVALQMTPRARATEARTVWTITWWGERASGRAGEGGVDCEGGGCEHAGYRNQLQLSVVQVTQMEVI